MKNNTNGSKSTNGTETVTDTAPNAQKRAGRSAKKAKRETAVKPLADEPVALVEARIDVGLGNRLFIRGQGEGLSWSQGQPLTCVEPAKWVWLARPPQTGIVFKLLLNDEIWDQGGDVVLEPGRTIELAPRF